MPSFTEVPRNSLVASLSMADAVEKLGGKAHNDDMTKLMQRKSGGAWRYLTTSAVQHGLITYANWIFGLTPLYESIVSASAEERQLLLQRAFSNPPVYRRIIPRLMQEGFNIENYLVQEEGFDEHSASIISRNFIEGAVGSPGTELEFAL